SRAPGRPPGIATCSRRTTPACCWPRVPAGTRRASARRRAWPSALLLPRGGGAPVAEQESGGRPAEERGRGVDGQRQRPGGLERAGKGEEGVIGAEQHLPDPPRGAHETHQPLV